MLEIENSNSPSIQGLFQPPRPGIPLNTKLVSMTAWLEQMKAVFVADTFNLWASKSALESVCYTQLQQRVDGTVVVHTSKQGRME